MARHHWWRQILSVTNSDPGNDQHLCLCELLGCAIDYDQLTCPNQAFAESTTRRMQLWEERYADKLLVATDGSTGAGRASEPHLFLGVPTVQLWWHQPWNAGWHHSWRKRLWSLKSAAKHVRNEISWRRRRCPRRANGSDGLLVSLLLAACCACFILARSCLASVQMQRGELEHTG